MKLAKGPLSPKAEMSSHVNNFKGSVSRVPDPLCIHICERLCTIYLYSWKDDLLCVTKVAMDTK